MSLIRGSLRSGIILCLICGFLTCCLYAQQHPNSPVLKSYVPSDKHSLVHPNDLTYELWQDFLLVKKANEGDPIAQHELGIRYLSGKSFSFDTVKAAYWIMKAAEQDLPSARYNLGILQNNGWGLPWNPFEAFRNIAFAASRGMPEAEYVLGMFYLENLVVPRSEQEALCYVSAAADSHYIPAMEALTTFRERGIGRHEAKETQAKKQSAQPSSPTSSAARVMFLDFDRDTSTHVPDTTLVGEVVRDGSPQLKEMFDSLRTIVDSSEFVDMMKRTAEAGSPEALTILGRWFEVASHVEKDVVKAALYYIRATRFDSPRAPFLLWNLTRSGRLFDALKSRIHRRDSDAKTVWASLAALQFDNQLTRDQAISMIESAANEDNVHALVELGLWYIQGGLVEKDRPRGIRLWEKARALGSREAEIRLSVTELMSTQDSSEAAHIVSALSGAMDEGSVLAQVAIGYCRERGLGMPRDVAGAVQMYRTSAERGSLIGFEALKRMYDAIRPDDEEFRIDE